ALAESTNHEGERTAAWERINHLLTEYRLDLADIATNGAAKTEVINHQIDLTRYSPGRRWRLALLCAVSEYLPLKILYAGQFAWIYCKPDELQIALYLYDSICNQLEKSSRSACREQAVKTNAQKW